MVYSRLVLLLILIATSAGVVSCKKKRSERIETITPKTEPEFKSEGTLAFMAENDTIKSIEIEIADNDAERMQGMMHRTSMDYDKGMLFIFNREEEQSFWMKNTKMSLDIFYINANREVVSIYKHTQPYSETPIPSLEPALYVVETAAGFADKFGIEVGQKIEFSRSNVTV